jgi:hypothetical protein
MVGQERVRLRFHLEVSPHRVFVTLFTVEVGILLIDLLVYHTVDQPDLRRLFDLNLEANLPTVWSVLLAGAVATAALLVARPAAGPRRWAWLGIAVFFAFVALDDAAQVHERLATAWSDMAHASDESSWSRGVADWFESYYWQLLMLPFFVVAGILMALFVVRELGWPVAWLFFVGLGFYANAVVLDYFDAYRQLYYPVGGLLDWRPQTAQHMARNVEEFIEMFGTTCILTSLLRHLGRSEELTA